MAYSSGGTIQAIDYNYFTWGGNTTGTYSGTINNISMVWGRGTGYKGYGQDVSLISAVTGSSTTTITATQWAGLVYTLNRTLGHQGGAAAQLATGSNIGITAGATITAFANVATAIGTINTNANTYTALGTVTTGTVFQNFVNFFAGNTGQAVSAANTVTYGRRITFASGDAARYFFNAGGRIRWYCNATSLSNTLRAADLVTNWGTNQAGGEISGGASLGRIGTGGTVGANVTTAGYWALATGNTTVSRITSANYRYEYNQDFTLVNARVTGTNVSGNGDNGSVIELYANVFMQGLILGPSSYNDRVNVNFGWRVDIVEPETTYLANTWGVIGITSF